MRSSEEFARQLIDNMLGGMIRVATDGSILEANAEAGRIIGIPSDKLKGQSVYSIDLQRCWEDGSPASTESWPAARCLRTREPQPAVTMGIRRNDGQTVWAVFTAAPLVNMHDGQFAGAVVTLLDITPQKRAERALHEREELFRRTFEGGAVGMALVALDLCIMACNEPICRMLGYTQDELRGMHVEDITAPEDVSVDLELCQRLIADEIPSYRLEKRYLHKQGHHVWGELTVTLVRDENRVALYVLSIVHDISDRKTAKAEFDAISNRMQALIHASPLAICSLDLDARITSWSHAGERLLGWTEAELLGRPMPWVVDTDRDETQMLLQKVLKGAGFIGIEVQRHRKDGTLIHLSISSAPLRGPDGQITGCMGVLQDITESKRMASQLVQAQRMETVGRLAGGVAHDFNNLLALISGYSEAMRRRLAADDPIFTHAWEIDKAAMRGVELTRQLLAFSRPQKIAPAMLNLNQVIEAVEGMLRRVLDQRIGIEIQFEPALGMVLADRGQMEQVLLNLAINARDAMPSGGLLRISTANMNQPVRGRPDLPPCCYVTLSVSDTGVGMDEQTRLRIFEPFFTTKEGKGTGLGLSIVYGIVHQCDGAVHVESEIGKGSCFEIWLLRVEQPEPVS